MCYALKYGVWNVTQPEMGAVNSLVGAGYSPLTAMVLSARGMKGPAEAKAYTPETKSISSGQVLQEPYTFEKARIIVWEMLELLALDLVEKRLVTDQIVLTIGYDIENLTDPKISANYHGDVTTDHYGRKVPKHAHGTANLKKKTSSSHIISEATVELFDRIVDKNLLIRRITIAACKLDLECNVKDDDQPEQLTLFDDPDELMRKKEAEDAALAREKKMQRAVVDIKNRFGKNAILKGMNLEEGATARDRNAQIGGHKA